MPPTIQLQADPFLREETLVASFSTARYLRSILGECGLVIESSEDHADDEISVPLSMYDDFDSFLRCMTRISGQSCAQ